eukprot:TRINITY_DN2561_c0_g1_i2.p1 TRINITY_DN2561_c0_g1~~TRINITY_DN2561_c0_g1_i2.p1  ORF type:complete len:106 (-),score=25.13 TRINITY_DN2561_c0_g1_i2:11-328(-)
MAPNYSGVRNLDHERLMELAGEAKTFALKVLKPVVGKFLCKISRGGGENDFKKSLLDTFGKVEFIKPPASRVDSSEIYIFASQFKNLDKNTNANPNTIEIKKVQN